MSGLEQHLSGLPFNQMFPPGEAEFVEALIGGIAPVIVQEAYDPSREKMVASMRELRPKMEMVARTFAGRNPSEGSAPELLLPGPVRPAV